MNRNVQHKNFKSLFQNVDIVLLEFKYNLEMHLYNRMYRLKLNIVNSASSLFLSLIIIFVPENRKKSLRPNVNPCLEQVIWIKFNWRQTKIILYFYYLFRDRETRTNTNSHKCYPAIAPYFMCLRLVV